MLTANQIETLNAFANRIIPPDDAPDGAPGAVEAGAVTSLLKLLATDLAFFQDDYRAFLDELDAEARRQHHQPFAALPVEAQEEFLRAIEDMFIFHAFAEHMHECYWTSEAGLKLTGFEVTG